MRRDCTLELRLRVNRKLMQASVGQGLETSVAARRLRCRCLVLAGIGAGDGNRTHIGPGLRTSPERLSSPNCSQRVIRVLADRTAGKHKFLPPSQIRGLAGVDPQAVTAGGLRGLQVVTRPTPAGIYPW